MRMAALSRSTGVPVPTIKFYLREGLLPPGRRTSPNQSQYDDQHVHRLALIRGLTEIGGVSLARVGEILSAVDDPQIRVHDLVGIVAENPHPSQLERGVSGGPPRYDLIDGVMFDRGWQHEYNAGHRLAAAMLLAVMTDLKVSPTPAALQVYADAAQTMAEVDVAAVLAPPSPSDALETVAAAIVLGDALAAILHRMAQASLTAPAGD